jgi:hypothetical protein
MLQCSLRFFPGFTREQFVNRRQMLAGAGAAGVAWASTGGNWGAARAAAFSRNAAVRPAAGDSSQAGTYSSELGGIVNGTFTLRVTSVTHNTQA